MAILFHVPLALAGAVGLTAEILAYVQDRYGAAAERRVEDWDRLMSGYARAPEPEKLDRVNRFFNRMRFLSDAEHWGRRDYWATPIEMLGTRGGDCEDFSIAKYFTLREMGVPDARLRVTYVRALGLKQAHMVLAYYPTPDADPLILDNLIDEIRRGSRRRDLVPVYSFNGEGLWQARERGQGRRVGGSQGISLWRDLTARMARERSGASGGARAASAPRPRAEPTPTGQPGEAGR
jgi:predicted transglutaminase-like cysteine proteinase